MMMAVARCLAGARRDALYMQAIDSNVDELPQPRLLAETMLRIHIAEQWKNAEYEPLRCLKRELQVSDGVLEIERFAPSAELDDHYNSDKREIKNAMPLSSTVVAKEAVRAADMVTINVRKYFISAVKAKSVGPLFIVSKTRTETGQELLAFSKTLQSSLNAEKEGSQDSAMSFGAVSEVGYVELRSVDINLNQKISNLGYGPVTEWDYHQFFADALLTSPSNSGKNCEISSGCKVFDVAKEPNLPYWLDLSNFAYYRRFKADDKCQVYVRAQLKEQTTEESVQKILLDRFISGLCTMLHISEDESRVTPRLDSLD